MCAPASTAHSGRMSPPRLGQRPPATDGVEGPEPVADVGEDGRAGGRPGLESPLRSWVAEDPARAVPDIDVGTRWTDPAAPDRYHRLAWIPTTGELYVTDPAESYVRVLARIPTQEQLAAVLDGWTTVSASPQAPLRWVEDRLAAWQEDQEQDEQEPEEDHGTFPAAS